MDKKKMIQRLATVMLCVVMIVGMMPAFAVAESGGGESSTSLSTGTEYPETVEGLGTEEDPLRIETAAQLAALAWSVNHGSLPDSLPEYPYLILVNDLDLSDYDENEDEYGKGWVPIGGYYGGHYDEDGDIKTYAFRGTFDGNHKTIQGLYVERGARYVGLFGYVKEGTVKNLTVENGDVEGYAATGGIVGALYNGQIENCAFSGSVAGEECTGGIVGELDASQAEDCKNTGSITGKAATGGIVGGAGSDSENDYLRNCINTGTVTGADAYTGGIVGILVGMTADYCVNTGTVQGGTELNTGGVAGTISEGIIQNCVNTGTVQGGAGLNTGGVAGTIFEGIIQNCTNGGPVSGSANNIGGLAGLVSAGTIQNCVSYADVSGTANSVGGVAGFAEEGSAVTNCLTTGNISGEVNIIERGGVSGVVGWLQNGSGDENTITGCVALGQTVIKDGEMGNLARITAMDDIWGNTVSDNFAWSGMQLFWDDELIPEEDYSYREDGESVDAAMLRTLWTTGPLAEDWSAAGVWTLSQGKLPILTDLNLLYQSDQFPSYIPAAPVNPGGNGSGGSGGSRSTPTYNAEISGGGTLPISADMGTGHASIDLGAITGNLGAGGNTIIHVPPIQGISSYTANLPSAALSGNGKGALTVNTGFGSITLPGNMLSGTDLVGNAGITVGRADTSSLPESIQEAIGNHPVIRLTLSMDGKQTDWNNPGAAVRVTIPYRPTAEELENPESIVIWYIDGSGNIVNVPNGRYDAITGTVIFQTTHFSKYSVAYNAVNFSDVTRDKWYYKAINHIAARGITSGTGNGQFNPHGELSRGEFMVLMMNAFGLAPDEKATENFADAGNTYYTGYLAAAKKQSLSEGVGNNLFAPNKKITRQEMFTLLYNTLQVVGEMPEGSQKGSALTGFTDVGQIKPWAYEAATKLVESGAIAGSGGKLSPAATMTRAEMAQVLYNLM